MAISLCIIAKNEEKVIANCLESVSSLVDEIIFVDTGSTDKTIEIAKKFTSKIFHFKWNDNFSDAKNFALSKAAKEWILALDADETISKKDHEKIRMLTQDGGFLGFSLIQRNYTSNIGGFNWTSCKDDSYEESKKANGYIPRKMIRLFKNDERIRFEGVVHENVGNSILKVGKIKETGIPIHHFGISTSNPEKIKKYIEIEKKNLKNDFFQDCQIGVQLHSIGKNEEAEKFLRKSISENPLFPYSFLELGRIMLEKSSLEESEKLLKKAGNLIQEPMLYNFLGILYGKKQDFEKSVFYLKKAISLLAENADFHYNLGLTYLKLEMESEAFAEFKKAIELNPEYKKKVELS